MFSLVFVVLVVGHIAVPKQGLHGEDKHGAPAQQDDSELKKVPLVPKIGPSLLLQ